MLPFTAPVLWCQFAPGIEVELMVTPVADPMFSIDTDATRKGALFVEHPVSVTDAEFPRVAMFCPAFHA